MATTPFMRKRFIFGGLLFIGTLIILASMRMASGAEEESTIAEQPLETKVLTQELPNHPIPHNTPSRRKPAWSNHTFQCLHFVRTGGCSPNGPIETTIPCNTTVDRGLSGYCLVKDLQSGIEFGVMNKTCGTHHVEKRFKCDSAMAFENYGADLETFKGVVPYSEYKTGRGVVIATKGGGHLREAYACIQNLRKVGCTLPVEIWVHGDEVKEDDKSLAYLKNSTEGVSVRVCRDKKVAGFTIKPYALIHSGFDEVLLMDPDNIAILDPTVLFKTSVYKKTGAIFWPDYWRPRNTPLFHVHEESLFWSLLELSFVDMFEQESAELVVNRRVHSDALRVLLFFITEPQQFMSEWKFVHGDKDMFRLAWMKARSPFHMIQRPPGSVGDKPNEPHVFCGTTIAQYHPNEKDVMFLHRNMLKYSENGNSPGWQLIQQYKQGLDPKKYLDVEFTGGLGKRPLCAGVHKKERIGDRYTIQSVNTTWITTEKQYIQNMLHFEKGLQNLNKKN